MGETVETDLKKEVEIPTEPTETVETVETLPMRYEFNEYTSNEIASSYITVFSAVIFASCIVFLLMRAIVGGARA